MAYVGRLLRTGSRLPGGTIISAVRLKTINRNCISLNDHLTKTFTPYSSCVAPQLISHRAYSSEVASAPAGEEDASTIQHTRGTSAFLAQHDEIKNKIRIWDYLQLPDVKKLIQRAYNDKIGSVFYDCGSLRALRDGENGNPQIHRETLAERIIPHQSKYYGYGLENESPMTVKIFNMRLRVMIENHAVFSVSDFLEQMQDQFHLAPNRVTYQLCAQKYCEDGDIQSASAILEHMKKDDIAVAPFVFHSLIRALASKGDSEGMEAIMEKMREQNIEPDVNACRAMLHGYAASGNLPAFTEVMESLDSGATSLIGTSLHPICIDMVLAGHSSLLPEVLKVLKEKNALIMSRGSMYAVFRLVAEGHGTEAVQLFQALHDSEMGATRRFSHGRQLVQELLRKGAPAEVLDEAAQYLISVGDIADYGMVVEEAKFHCAPSNVCNMLDLVLSKSAESEVYSVLHSLSQKLFKIRDVNGLYEFAAKISALRMSAGQIYSLTFPSITSCGQTDEQIFQRFEEMKMPHKLVKVMRVCQALTHADYEAIQNLSKSGNWNVLPNFSYKGLLSGLAKHKNMEGCLEALQQILGRRRTPANIRTWSNFLSDICLQPNHYTESDSPSQILTYMEAKGLLIQYDIADEMLQNPGKFHINDEDVKLIEKLKNKELSESDPLPRQPQSDPRERGAKAQLLRQHCISGDVEEAEALKSGLSAEGFIFRGASLAALSLMAARYKEDLSEALKYKQLLEMEFPEFVKYRHAVLYIAKLMLKENQVEEALAMLQDFVTRHSDAIQPDEKDWVYSHVMGVVTEVAPPTIVPEFANVLGQISGQSNRARILPKALHLCVQSGDAEKAVNLLNAMSPQDKTGYTHNVQKVCRLLISQENSQLLQRVLEIVTRTEGETRAMAQLVTSLLDSNKPSEALSMLQSPGVLTDELIEKLAVQLYLNGKVEPLEQLISFSEDLSEKSRDELIFQMIRIHIKNNELDKAEHVEEIYQQHNVEPSARTLRYMANVLKSNDRPVPFDAPSKQDRPGPLGSESVSERAVMRAVTSGDVAAVMDALHPSDGGTLKPEFVRKLGVHLVKKRWRGLYKLADKLVEARDEETLQLLQANIKNTSGIFFKAAILKLHIDRGDAEQALQELEANTDLLKDKYSFSLEGLTLLGEKQPELLPRADAVIRSFAKSNSDVNQASLLRGYYICSGQNAAEQALIEEIPQLKERIPSKATIKILHESQNEERLVELTEQHAGQKPWFVFYNAILLKCELGKLDEAVTLYHRAAECGVSFRRESDVHKVLKGHIPDIPDTANEEEDLGAPEHHLQENEETQSSSESSESDSSDSDSDQPDEQPKV